MTIHALGTVRSVDPASGAVDVEWAPEPEGREWYFWTGIQALWPVHAGEQDKADQMLNFVFDGAEQDLDSWLADPYWETRFAPLPGFTWIPFYEEMASRLLQFRHDNARLAAMLVEQAQITTRTSST